jgi:DNA-directed RNA polymerase subunit alpha
MPEQTSIDLSLAIVPVDAVDGFSARVSNVLKNERVRFLGDLVQLTDADLLRWPNFGRQSLRNVKAVLTSMGLRLGMELPEDWRPIS